MSQSIKNRNSNSHRYWSYPHAEQEKKLRRELSNSLEHSVTDSMDSEDKPSEKREGAGQRENGRREDIDRNRERWDDRRNDRNYRDRRSDNGRDWRNDRRDESGTDGRRDERRDSDRRELRRELDRRERRDDRRDERRDDRRDERRDDRRDDRRESREERSQEGTDRVEVKVSRDVMSRDERSDNSAKDAKPIEEKRRRIGEKENEYPRKEQKREQQPESVLKKNLSSVEAEVKGESSLRNEAPVSNSADKLDASVMTPDAIFDALLPQVSSTAKKVVATEIKAGTNGHAKHISDILKDRYPSLINPLSVASPSVLPPTVTPKSAVSNGSKQSLPVTTKSHNNLRFPPVISSSQPKGILVAPKAPMGMEIIPTKPSDSSKLLVQKKDLESLPKPSVSLDLYGKYSFFVPMRLSAAERDLLMILEGALDVSEYTNHVDNRMYQSKRNDLSVKHLHEFLNCVIGLTVAQDKPMKKEFLTFDTIFEIGRRYKILNPTKMRSTYGKLMFIIQDAQRLNWTNGRHNFAVPIKSVNSFLKEKGALALLSDPLLLDSMQDVTSPELDLARKRAQAAIYEKYASVPRDDMELCLSSLADYKASLVMASRPIEMLLHYLVRYFNPNIENQGPYSSLSISKGRGGSCLSHSHQTQYYFVLQSLSLWKEIITNMWKLWIQTDQDLLDVSNPYQLVDTGQGHNRLQSCPKVRRYIENILHQVQVQSCRNWVGLSVIHLGDRDVPNSLVFIDKYNQVMHILNPIAQCLDRVSDIGNDPVMKIFLKPYDHSVANAQRAILSDFFKHGFDGSGDDGGSCIDGRLTSAWNWCSKIENKSFYSLFMLSGFQGFDGSFRK